MKKVLALLVMGSLLVSAIALAGDYKTEVWPMISGNALDTVDDFSGAYDIRSAIFKGTDGERIPGTMVYSMAWTAVAESVVVRILFQGSVDGTHWSALDSNDTQIVSDDSLSASDNSGSIAISGFPLIRAHIRTDGTNDLEEDTTGTITNGYELTVALSK